MSIDLGLQYFTHEIDGRLYGAWYKIVADDQLEVIGVGLLESGYFAGFAPESAARSILENHVRLRARLGAPLPCLADVTGDEGTLEQDRNMETVSISPQERSRGRSENPAH